MPLSGGLGFLLIGLLLYLRFRHPALLIALLSGLVGLADDVTKTLRQGHGMKARYKILLLVLVSLCFFLLAMVQQEWLGVSLYCWRRLQLLTLPMEQMASLVVF